MTRLEADVESKRGVGEKVPPSSIHSTSKTEAIWARVTSEKDEAGKENLDASLSGIDNLRALFAGYDPIVHRKKAVEEIATALEAVRNPEERDERRKSVLDRLDVISRLGSVRRAFKIFFGEKINQKGLDFVDGLVRGFWDAYDNEERTYEGFLEFWKKEYPEVFRYVNELAKEKKFGSRVGDSLLPAYIWSLVSGDPSKMHDGFMDRLRNERSTQEVELDFESAPGTIVVSFSLIKMLGEDSVISKMMLGDNEEENRIGATDTLVNLYLPVGKKERVMLAKEYAKDQERISELILKGLKNSSGTVGLGHGFGANKDVWNSMIGELMYGLNDGEDGEFENKGFGMEGRLVGLSLSTKGADFTVLEGEDLDDKQQSGRMDRAAIQIIESLRAMGLGGWDREKPLLWIGHSMGGQEALWLPVFADRNWNLKIISITPVVDQSKEFLRILYGKLGEKSSEWAAKLTGLILSDKSPLPELVKEWAAWAGQRIRAIEFITKSLIIPKDIDEKSVDFQRLMAVVNTHLEQFKNLPFMRGVFKHLRDNNYLNEDWLRRILFMFEDSFEAVYMGGKDNILGPRSGLQKLILTGWESKIENFPNLPHYLTHMKDGIQALIEDGQRILADRAPFVNAYVFK